MCGVSLRRLRRLLPVEDQALARCMRGALEIRLGVMNLSDDYTALMLFEERTARLRGDAARERIAGTVAREGKPSRRRRRRRSLAPIIPMQRRPGELGGVAHERREAARESDDSSAAS